MTTSLHVNLGREWRGGQSQSLLLIRELQRHGHQAELLALKDSLLAERAHAAGIPVHAVQGFAARPDACIEIIRLRRRRFDVVHSHDAHGLTAAWVASHFCPAPLVISRRVAYPISRLWPARCRYERASRIIAVSRFVEGSILASGFPRESVSLVYDGVELPCTQRIGGDSPQLGCVGCLLPEKGQELLIQAMPIVLERYPKCRLILAGEGPSRGGLEQVTARLGIRSAVQFTGFVKDVVEVYRALDVFVFPSLAEPLGSSLLAAMAWRLPVVALDGGAIGEVIEHEKNGLVIRQRDPAAVASAILRLLDDATLRAGLGTAARSTIEDRFSARRLVEETVAVYRQVCKMP